MSGSEEVVVSQLQGITFKVTKAAEMLEKNGTVTITAINTAISTAVTLVELLKHRVKGLHQVNTFERVPDSFKTRVVFKLSFKTEETTSTGYQKPIPENEVQEKTLTELKKPPWGDRNVDSKVEPGETNTGETVERRGRWGGRRRFGSRGRRGRFNNYREGTDRDVKTNEGEDEGGNADRGDWVQRTRRAPRGTRGTFRGERGGSWADRGGERGGSRWVDRGGERGGSRWVDRGGERGGSRRGYRGYRGDRGGDRDWNNEERGGRGDGRGYRRPRGEGRGRRGGYGGEDRGNRGDRGGYTRGGRD